MALFMITLHNKGVLTGGKNTLITACGLEQQKPGCIFFTRCSAEVLFTIFVPALFLTGTHATRQAHPIVSYEGLS